MEKVEIDKQANSVYKEVRKIRNRRKREDKKDGNKARNKGKKTRDRKK